MAGSVATDSLYATKSQVMARDPVAVVLGIQEPAVTHSPIPAGTNSGAGRRTWEWLFATAGPLPLKIIRVLASPVMLGAVSEAYRLTYPLVGSMEAVWMVRPFTFSAGETICTTPFGNRLPKCLPTFTAFIFFTFELNDCSRRIPLSCRSKAIARGSRPSHDSTSRIGNI